VKAPSRGDFDAILRRLDILLAETVELRQRISNALRANRERPFWPDRRRSALNRTIFSAALLRAAALHLSSATCVPSAREDVRSSCALLQRVMGIWGSMWRPVT
jgi:hypothetical protein